MHARMKVQLAALAVLQILVSACGRSGEDAKTAPSADNAAAGSGAKAEPPLPPKTEALPADGGEVGNAYRELIAAYQAVDSARVNRLFDHSGSDPTPVDKARADSVLPDMLKVHPSGGLRLGDRATLFLDGGTWH